MLKKWKWVVDLCFYSGVGLGIYALASAYLGTANGACPIDARRPLITLAIGLLLFSIIAQWLLEKHDKKLKASAVQDEAHDDTGMDA